jgi:hypothetical protein
MNPNVARNIDEFFTRVAENPQALLRGIAGTLRIDLDEDGGIGHWLLRFDHGRVDVSRKSARADAVLTADKALFGRLVTGEANALTAGLRGQLRMDGETRLVAAFGRLLPGPPGRHTTLPPAAPGAKRTARSAKATGTAARTGRTSVAVASMTRRDRAR